MIVGFFDVPLVILAGVLSAITYRRWLRSRSENWYLCLTVTVTGLAWLHTVSGNQGILGYWNLVGGAVSLPPLIGGIYVLAYPLWFRAAGEMTFMILGRRPDQGGILWVFRLADRTDPVKPAWEVSWNTDHPEEEPSETEIPEEEEPSAIHS